MQWAWTPCSAWRRWCKKWERKRKQTRKAKESQEQDVNDENVTKENEGVKVGGKFKCWKKSVPSDKVLKENAQNHAAVAGCLNMLQEAYLCKFQTAFSDQVKLNPETHTPSLSWDFANHTISSLIPIDAPKAISNIMTTTTPTSPFTEVSVQVTNTGAQNGSSTSAHDQSLSPIFQFPILKASVKKNPSQSSSLHTNKRQPFNKASNFSSLSGAMASSNSSIIIQSSKVTSHHAQPHPQHCHAPINDSAVPESFHNTQHPPQVNGVPQNYNIPSHVPEIENQPPATHSRPIIQRMLTQSSGLKN